MVNNMWEPFCDFLRDIVSEKREPQQYVETEKCYTCQFKFTCANYKESPTPPCYKTKQFTCTFKEIECPEDVYEKQSKEEKTK